LEWCILHLVQTERRMLHRLIHLPMAQLRIMLHPVFCTLHRKSTNMERLAAFRQLILVQRHAPGLDMLVQFLLVLQTSGDRRELLQASPRRAAHHLHQSLPFLVSVADDHTPIIVAARMRAISVMGSHSRTAVVVDEWGVRPMGTVTRRKSRPA